MIHLQCTHYSIFKTQFTHVISVTSFSASTLLVGRQKGHLAWKTCSTNPKGSHLVDQASYFKLEVTPEK